MGATEAIVRGVILSQVPRLLLRPYFLGRPSRSHYQLGKQIKASSTKLVVIIHIATLEDKSNPLQLAIILNGMITLIIHFNDFTDW